MPALYIGAMTGTSADGLDVCLASFDAGRPREHAHLHEPFPDELRTRILEVCRHGDLAAAATIDVELADATVTAVQALLERAGVRADEVRAIGSHGQTVFHRPDGPAPTSVQLGDPHRIAVRSGIDVVADFRRADVAAGGEGAPLAPGFHATVFRQPGEARAVVNLGGMANVTVLPATGGPVLGFDTGPANVLLDAWIERERGAHYDADGAWAAGGRVDAALLERMRADAWFRRPPPKSTGREYFNPAWLERHLARQDTRIGARDVQATLAELTASTVADAIRDHAPGVGRVLVCGGGARNADLQQRLARQLGDVLLESTAAHGVEPEHVEAMAFAWLAERRIAEQPANCPSVTGATRELVLGALIRAPRSESGRNPG